MPERWNRRMSTAGGGGANTFDAVNQRIWSLPIELRLEHFVIVEKCK